MNKQTGNMYPFVTHTWNPIRGECPHKCGYCYMKTFPQKPLHINQDALYEKLGSGNFIFIGSSTDMWAKEIPSEWIESVLLVCGRFPNNTYLFQSKNPKRFMQFFPAGSPKNIILGTTLETNDISFFSFAPSVYERAQAMKMIGGRKMISIEPIVKFNRDIFLKMIREISPEFISIGADSKKSNLQEPSKDDIVWLINEMKKFTDVRIKNNLERLWS